MTLSQALEDLPDPLDPPPAVPAASTDDLLAKMADDAIDRLLASVDKGGPAEVPASPLPVSSVDQTLADELAAAPATPPAATEAEPGVDAASLGLDEASLASAIDDVLPFTDVEESPPVVVPPPEPEPAVEALPAAAVAVAASQPIAEAPAADVKALLKEEPPAAAGSVLLLPLRILNLPFAWIGDRGRTFAGLLGVVTLVPAACAIVYVLFLRGR